MVKRIEYNVMTGEQTEIELTAEEIAEAKRLSDVADAEQAEIQSQPTAHDLITQQQTLITSLTARIAALEAK
jgi:predicted DNA-binding protein (UPF0251 family)